MWTICKKEWQQFFGSLTGYVAIIIFLLLMGLFLFVFPDTSLLDFGYASLNGFFELAPLILLFLVPVVTMRSLADEYKSGTFELLKTMPLSAAQIVWGKIAGAFMVVAMAVVPTVIYAFSMQALSSTGGIDVGSTTGSYIGLLLLGAVFTAVGVCASSFTNNTVVAFIAGAFMCFLLYNGFEAVSKLPVFSNGLDYYIEMLGIKFHYHSISRGVVDVRDIVYFAGMIFLFAFVTQRMLLKR
ncbi:ABC transporter permease subunit [Foetidibacter luteolus]|uniref:ABC transporter permease subunit n=1 Tax=Foetidibacter luteolus TaxID=2608880 RepID=UPI00129B2961|nr:ABC transporter permease subunit [Foetidibacter luteolus]